MAELRIEVPDDLAVEIFEALQHTHASVIAGATTPAQAAQAVIAWWMANTLSQYQAEKVRTAKEPVVQAARHDLENSVESARAAAWKKVKDVMQVGNLPEHVTPGPDRTA